ncbi:doublecortin domain-containing protein 2B [Ornithorhynchus anatinus]|uniref:doublecortin domain-containing protein 2B n=1 Tax=Ornithorhynchus anatinus TaxID=9258 RepID=UPI0019D4CA36|nr:doublecortin domain-containing protein 2B [Ornithorhynchus anatinus]
MPSNFVTPAAKRVVIYRNGDPFFRGRRFVVNPRRVLTFEAFLAEVTTSVGSPTAVRALYTPRRGHRVTELGQLQAGGGYVAAGFERFKRLDHGPCSGMLRGRCEVPMESSTSSPVARQASGNYHRSASGSEPWAGGGRRVSDASRDRTPISPTSSYLNLGGKPIGDGSGGHGGQTPALRLQLAPPPPAARRRWAALLSRLTARAALPRGAGSEAVSYVLSLLCSLTGSVGFLLGSLARPCRGPSFLSSPHRLCTLAGVPISDETALVNGDYYVAVGEEEYLPLPYSEMLLPSPSLPPGPRYLGRRGSEAGQWGAGRGFREAWRCSCPFVGWEWPEPLVPPIQRWRKADRGPGRWAKLPRNTSLRQTKAAGTAGWAHLHGSGVSANSLSSQVKGRQVRLTGAREVGGVGASPLSSRCRPRGEPGPGEDTSTFYARPGGMGLQGGRPLPSEPEGSVYTARNTRREVRGAQEVVEDEATWTEIPLDQVRALFPLFVAPPTPQDQVEVLRGSSSGGCHPTARSLRAGGSSACPGWATSRVESASSSGIAGPARWARGKPPQPSSAPD